MLIVMKYGTIVSLCLSVIITASHYFAHAVLYTETTFWNYTEEIKQKLGATLLTYTGQKDVTPTLSMDPKEIVRREAQEAGIKPDLVEALIEIESNWKQDAIAFNPEQELKIGKMRAAAHGLMQVQGIHAGGPLCPESSNWSDLYKPEINIRCGVRILKAGILRQRNMLQALGEYNGGAGCVRNGEIICAESKAHATKVVVALAQNMTF